MKRGSERRRRQASREFKEGALIYGDGITPLPVCKGCNEQKWPSEFTDDGICRSCKAAPTLFTPEVKSA